MDRSQLHILLIRFISAELITAKRYQCEPFHLCFWGDEIYIRNVKHTYLNHPIFHTFTAQQTRNGCAPVELLKITKPIIEFLKERPECLKQFKL